MANTPSIGSTGAAQVQSRSEAMTSNNNNVQRQDNFSTSTLQTSSSCCLGSFFTSFGNCFSTLFSLIKSIFCCAEEEPTSILESKDKDGYTLLARAFENADRAVAKQSPTNEDLDIAWENLGLAMDLIKNGANIKAIKTKDNPLWVAIENGLRSKGWLGFAIFFVGYAEIERPNSSGLTPLAQTLNRAYYATKASDVVELLSIAKLLINNKANYKNITINQKPLIFSLKEKIGQYGEQEDEQETFGFPTEERRITKAWKEFFNFLVLGKEDTETQPSAEQKA